MENELSFMSLFLTSDWAWFANVIKLKIKKNTPTRRKMSKQIGVTLRAEVSLLHDF